MYTIVGVIKLNQKEIRTLLASRLREFRIASGMTAKEVGQKVGKSEKTVSAWEHGRGQPDADMLFTLCDLYGVKSFDLFYSREPFSFKEMITGDLPVSLPDGWDGSIPQLDDQEQYLIDTFRTLNEKGKEAVLAHLEIVAGNPAMTTPPSTAKKAT